MLVIFSANIFVSKSLIALLIVVCGKSLYNKHFYNVINQTYRI